MIGLEFILHIHEVQQQDLAKDLKIAKQNISRWFKKERPIPDNHLKTMSKQFKIPEKFFIKDINDSDRMEILKYKINNKEH